MLTLAAAAQPDQGWGNVSALIGAALAFWLFTALYRRWKAAPDTSPTTGGPLAVEGIKPQLTGGGDPFDPADEPAGQEWGAIDRSVGVQRVTVPPRTPVRQAADLDTWVDQQVGQSRPVDIIAEARRRFGKSPATVKRAIKRVRTHRQVTG